MSPEKSVCSVAATKLYTVVAPLGPLYRFHETPPMVGEAMGVVPVDEMGNEPPSAASQIMISYSLLPLGLELVNRSYATSASMEVPV